jgi:hemolysin type calcium-binding protein/WD40 repeat protein
VKKQFLVLGLVLVAVLVAAGQLAHANAGPSPNDIQDSLPVWNADGVHLAFERTAPKLEHVVRMTSAGKDLYVAYPTGQLRGFVGDDLLIESNGETLVTRGGRFAGPPAILHGVGASASPDASRVAYVRAGTLYSSKPDGTDERSLAVVGAPSGSDVVGAAWSPDGTRIAISSGGALLVVNVDGSGSRQLNTGTNPSWSPDGSMIAFERAGQVWLLAADNSGERYLAAGRFPQFSPHSATVAYISDRQHVPGGATAYQYALYVQPISSVAHKLVDDVHPYSPPRWSPTGALIAVSGGQECLRWGIYVVNSSGGAAHRHSNLCRFTGTAGDDRVTGSLYFDRISGLGGDDVIIARSGSDRIEGNDGNDTIRSGAGNDFVFGGAGDDRIFGGTGDDTIIPGNGHDRIDCGPGNDTVEGAGPLDRIARNCEHVRH